MAQEQQAATVFEPRESERLVVLAVDPSENSLNAYNYYVKNLHRDENHLVLLFCPELSSVALRLLKDDKVDTEKWDKVMAEEKTRWSSLQEKYETLIKENNLKKAAFEVATSQHNKPGEAIVHYAQENQATMVIMGTRGLGTLKRTIMGSVSDYVVHHAHCPVIVCRK